MPILQSGILHPTNPFPSRSISASYFQAISEFLEIQDQESRTLSQSYTLNYLIKYPIKFKIKTDIRNHVSSYLTLTENTGQPHQRIYYAPPNSNRYTAPWCNDQEITLRTCDRSLCSSTSSLLQIFWTTILEAAEYTQRPFILKCLDDMNNNRNMAMTLRELIQSFLCAQHTAPSSQYILISFLEDINNLVNETELFDYTFRDVLDEFSDSLAFNNQSGTFTLWANNKRVLSHFKFFRSAYRRFSRKDVYSTFSWTFRSTNKIRPNIQIQLHEWSHHKVIKMLVIYYHLWLALIIAFTHFKNGSSFTTGLINPSHFFKL